MSKGVAGAIGLLLLWLSFFLLYVAFHPGGIRADFLIDPQHNPNGLARNPRDVLLYAIEKLNKGTDASPATPQ